MDTHFVTAGLASAPALVFIHGFPFSHEQWTPQLDVAARTHRAIAYDLRGHGATPLGAAPYLMDHLVDDLMGLLDHLEIERAALCGLSMGGYVALHAAVREPARISALLLCDTRAEGDDNAGRSKRAAGITKVMEQGVEAFCDGLDQAVFAPASLAAPSPALQRLRTVMRSTDRVAMCQALAAMAARHDQVASLGSIEAPTHVVVGSNDTLTPRAAADVLVAGITDATLAVLPDAGHVSNLENPEAFDQELTAFLGRI